MKLCFKIVYNILFRQNLSRRDLNVLVVLADTTQFGKLFHVLTTLFAKPNLYATDTVVFQVHNTLYNLKLSVVINSIQRMQY